MSQGISKIFYLGFRLAPFIIVCFFALQSLLNWDLKGIMYLVGLICACVITVTFGQTNPFKSEENNSSRDDLPNPRCNVITLGNNNTILSTVPVSIVVYSYTLFYLLIFMLNLANGTNSKGILGDKVMKQKNMNAVLSQNIPILILFPLLILMESSWIIYNRCLYGVRPIISILAATIIGGSIGIAWAVFITYTDKPELQYINKAGLDVCNQPSKMMYRCRAMNKSGQVVSPSSS
jgi:hypothetical protein